MRLLHLTDTHLGSRLHTTGSPSGWSRADDHDAALRAALAPALRGEVDAVLHTGDLFDRSRPPTRSVVAAAQIFCEVARQVPTVLFPGNHDRRGLQRYLPHALPGLHVVDRPTQVDLGSIRIACVPYFRRADDWALAARRAVGGGADLLAAHQAFHGSQIPPGFLFRVDRQPDTIGAAHLPTGTRWVACGHIHPRQAIAVGEACVVHPGSTERTSFSERTQTKGYAVWTFARQVKWRFVDLPSRPMAFVRSESELATIRPGTLVRVHRESDALRDEVLRRGGWITERGERSTRPTRAQPAPTLFG